MTGQIDETERGEQDAAKESVGAPAKVMRIGVMTRSLLEEARTASLDDAGRARLREIYEQSLRELATTLSPDLNEELARLAHPFESARPSDAELRMAQAQLVGWLEGLFQGIQAAFFAQQLDAQMQLEQMQRKGLPSGPSPGARPDEVGPRPGSYL